MMSFSTWLDQSSIANSEIVRRLFAANSRRWNLPPAARSGLPVARPGGPHVRIPYPDLLALVRFVAPFAGYPAAADTLARLGELAVELGMDTRPDDSGRSDANHARGGMVSGP
jgi:hypothetical protein